MAVSELKSNISNLNLSKSKKKQFFCFDNNHANQYIVNINKNLKKIDEKKHCFKRI